jgi:hypothetical protein
MFWTKRIQQLGRGVLWMRIIPLDEKLSMIPEKLEGCEGKLEQDSFLLIYALLLLIHFYLFIHLYFYSFLSLFVSIFIRFFNNFQ